MHVDGMLKQTQHEAPGERAAVDGRLRAAHAWFAACAHHSPISVKPQLAEQRPSNFANIFVHNP